MRRKQKNLIGRTLICEYTGKINYNFMPTTRRDNMNPVTEGRNTSPSYGDITNPIRVPSKKHKNRYKNFLKLFPNFKEKS